MIYLFVFVTTKYKLLFYKCLMWLSYLYYHQTFVVLIYLLKNYTHLHVCIVLFYSVISMHSQIRNMEKDMLNGISVQKIHGHNLEHSQLYQVTSILGVISTLLFCMNMMVSFMHCKSSHIHLFSILSQTDPLQHFTPSGAQNLISIMINYKTLSTLTFAI